MTRILSASTAALEVRERRQDDREPPSHARINEARQLYQAMTDRTKKSLS